MNQFLIDEALVHHLHLLAGLLEADVKLVAAIVVDIPDSNPDDICAWEIHHLIFWSLALRSHSSRHAFSTYHHDALTSMQSWNIYVSPKFYRCLAIFALPSLERKHMISPRNGSKSLIWIYRNQKNEDN
ncbi:hypothetical protein ABKN59_010080 [Abortiporus biennis]